MTEEGDDRKTREMGMTLATRLPKGNSTQNTA